MGLGLLRVLLVEDEHLIRLMASEMLRDEGFDVECSATGRMAGFRRSDGRSQRGVMMAFPKISDKKITR
jgi:DNA-binding response OmpR family regulator